MTNVYFLWDLNKSYGQRYLIIFMIPNNFSRLRITVSPYDDSIGCLYEQFHFSFFFNLFYKIMTRFRWDFNYFALKPEPAIFKKL